MRRTGEHACVNQDAIDRWGGAVIYAALAAFGIGFLTCTNACNKIVIVGCETCTTTASTHAEHAATATAESPTTGTTDGDLSVSCTDTMGKPTC